MLGNQAFLPLLPSHSYRTLYSRGSHILIDYCMHYWLIDYCTVRNIYFYFRKDGPGFLIFNFKKSPGFRSVFWPRFWSGSAFGSGSIFFQWGFRIGIRIRIKIKWILSTAFTPTFHDLILEHFVINIPVKKKKWLV